MKQQRVEIRGVQVALAQTKGRKRDNDVNKPISRSKPYFADLPMEKRRELLTFMKGEFPDGVELAFGKVQPIPNMFTCKTKTLRDGTKVVKPDGFSATKPFREPDSFIVEVVRLLDMIGGTVLEGIYTVQNVTNVANMKVAETQDMAFNDLLLRTMARGIR